MEAMTIREQAERLAGTMCRACALAAAEEIKQQLIQSLDNEVSAIHAIYWEGVKREITSMGVPDGR